MLNYIAWVLLSVLYAPALYNLYFGVTNWAVEDYSHIYFILPISLFLIWKRRTELKDALRGSEYNTAVNLISLLVLVSGVILCLFGWRRSYNSIHIFSLIPVLLGLIGYLYGSRVLKVLSFPVLYLLLLVPPPTAILDSITMPMRYGVSFVTESILHFFNYPIAREGLLLTIGYKDLFMAPACSGFRSLITMLSLSLAYIYLIKGGNLKKMIMALLIVPLALAGNLIRVITLCLITFYFGEGAGQGFFHNFSGIVVFMITMFGLISVEATINRLTPEEAKGTGNNG